jgi:hypothetical protein
MYVNSVVVLRRTRWNFVTCVNACMYVCMYIYMQTHMHTHDNYVCIHVYTSRMHIHIHTRAQMSIDTSTNFQGCAHQCFLHITLAHTDMHTHAYRERNRINVSYIKHTYIHTHTHTYIYTHTYTYIWYIHTYIHIYIYICIHTHIHTHIYMHTHSLSGSQDRSRAHWFHSHRATEWQGIRPEQHHGTTCVVMPFSIVFEWMCKSKWMLYLCNVCCDAYLLQHVRCTCTYIHACIRTYIHVRAVVF